MIFCNFVRSHEYCESVHVLSLPIKLVAAKKSADFRREMKRPFLFLLILIFCIGKTEGMVRKRASESRFLDLANKKHFIEMSSYVKNNSIPLSFVNLPKSRKSNTPTQLTDKFSLLILHPPDTRRRLLLFFGVVTVSAR